MTIIYSLIAVVIISLLSLIGLATFALKKEKLEHFLLYAVAFSVGALFGEVFLHILPELSEESTFTLALGLTFIGGILLFFVIERFIHWHHCHKVEHHPKIKPVAYMNLIGDSFHNLLDGMIIASAFIIDTTLGVATALAVVAHEIPQEISDFGILLYSGMSKKRALFFNILSALFAIIGALLVFVLAEKIMGIELYLLALAGGGFIYIAGSDLIPELHSGECSRCKPIYQFIFILLGLLLMGALLLLE